METTDFFTELKSKVDALFRAAVAATTDGNLTLAEAWTLVTQAVGVAYAAAAALQYAGSLKKERVLEVMGYLFDRIWPVVILPPLVARVHWALKWFLPTGWERAAFLFLIDRMIEGLHKVFNPPAGPSPLPAPAPPLPSP